jgi:ribonuclease HI
MTSTKLADTEYKRLERDYEFPERATNNQAELKGLELSLDLLEEQQTKEPRQKWVILTDSQYMRGIFQYGNNANKNTDIIERIKARLATVNIEKKVECEIQWVRAHCGIYFNEAADKLANAAAKRSEQRIGKTPVDHSREKHITQTAVNLIRKKPKQKDKHKPAKNNKTHDKTHNNSKPAPIPLDHVPKQTPTVSGQKRTTTTNTPTNQPAKRQAL